jgi:hypothetical protein
MWSFLVLSIYAFGRMVPDNGFGIANTRVGINYFLETYIKLLLEK